MNQEVKKHLKDLGETLSALGRAKVVEEIVTLAEQSVVSYNKLSLLLEQEGFDSKDKDALIAGLKEDIEELSERFKEEKECMETAHSNEVIKLKAEIKELQETLDNIERAETFALAGEVDNLNYQEILGGIKNIELSVKEIESRVEGTDKVVRNMNLNSNASQKSLAKLLSTVSNLVDLLKVYIKSVTKLNDKVSESTKVSKDCLDKCEEVQKEFSSIEDDYAEMKTRNEEVKTELKETRKEVSAYREEVKEVKGLFGKLKGLFSR